MTIIAASMLNDGLAQKLDYPSTNRVDHIDEYHGVKVADPYRWLEDDRSDETGEWVKAQNEVTFSYLDKIPFKNKIFLDLEKAYNYPKYSAPRKKGDYYYFYKNDGLQNQAVLYRQKGENGTPETVLDPNKLSADGTTRLTVFSLSKDGNHAVLGFSKGGSDWQEYQVMDMKTLSMLSDKVEWVKISGAAWQGDGFYYSRYPKPEGSALAAKNENHQVYFHKIGTTQNEDKLIFEDAANPQRFHTIGTTEDEQFAVLSVSDRGKGKDGNGLWILKKGEKTFNPIKEEITDFQYGVIENIGDDFLFETNENAPNSKVMRYVSASKSWRTVLPEKPEPLLGAGLAGNKLFASYSKDVSSRAYVFSVDGTLENEVKLPGLGTASGFGGERGDSFVFYTYTSFNYPPTIFKYDIASKKSAVFREPEVTFKPEDYETEQVFYPSKDGTKIPAFITYKKGMKRDGSNPTILYGYGGFNISLTPAFSPTRIPFLDQGGIYVQANLRGGSEYGEKWHEQGMKLKKQNVFDDFIAAAEFLIKEKYTSASKLAIQGGSNGGLLVGTVMNQRPELFKVAFPAVGVMDMLRFHKFTIGWNWIADYGSSDNAEEFKVLYAYSPLHNIKEGGKYPATMVTTADHDDRVVPAHSFKYAAELQAKAGKSSDNPLLIRIDTNSGHGASNTKKALETQADIYAFMFSNMGLVWK
ncbi:prolyl oligopeptidase family serine peptidase [Dyadobacter fanqingshengii]|uniref:prolyl oligopeptidase n=1 Tax=Dyadobacter fanqingshengii TaxID=2906443 RepID=A0A9X1T7W7_9BACT|nr:prolyl oligopeptidase family serine peptidase [Dyadobacter fanqingshengii]MCF0039111.1 prolyl oligopeptidase family serine peptidase [Dyadobacter fanqingshengii]USJ34069.1 prolyl oligopeptidase family serine peptidase [Dyadobacter fanqingshengii]